MNLFPLRDRPLTPAELEQIRLILSTFRDGGGAQTVSGQTFPGWRDAERAFAALLSGTAPEGKGIFDVIVPAGEGDLPYGLSVKTSTIRNEVFVISELHNSLSKAHALLGSLQINWMTQPQEAGEALVRQVLGWHEAESELVDVPRSSYVHLVHDKTWTNWRVLWFPLRMLETRDLTWGFSGSRIYARTHDNHTLWEWYGKSGGQFKWYPRISDALWDSGYFSLEATDPTDLTAKAKFLFPDLWENSTLELSYPGPNLTA